MFIGTELPCHMEITHIIHGRVLTSLSKGGGIWGP